MEQTPGVEVEVMDMPGQDRQGRCWYTSEAKRSYLEHYRASGLSQGAFCERERLKLPTIST